MTFSEMEVGKWYWFKAYPCLENDEALIGECREDRGGKFLWVGEYPYDSGLATDIAPVPSQAEWAALVDAAKKAANELEMYEDNIETCPSMTKGDLRRAIEMVGEA